MFGLALPYAPLLYQAGVIDMSHFTRSVVLRPSSLIATLVPWLKYLAYKALSFPTDVQSLKKISQIMVPVQSSG